MALVAFAVHTSNVAAAEKSANQPAYSKDGKLVLPSKLSRVVLPDLGPGNELFHRRECASMFTNVFVPPEAYKNSSPPASGQIRRNSCSEMVQPRPHGSINKGGHYQNALMGWDVEVKDSTRPQQWTYYNFDAKETSADPLQAPHA